MWVVGCRPEINPLSTVFRDLYNFKFLICRGVKDFISVNFFMELNIYTFFSVCGVLSCVNLLVLMVGNAHTENNAGYTVVCI